MIDTFLKPGNIEDVGPTYLPAMGFFLMGNVVAARTANRRFHQLWVTASVLGFAVLSLGVFADVFSSG